MLDVLACLRVAQVLACLLVRTAGMIPCLRAHVLKCSSTLLLCVLLCLRARVLSMLSMLACLCAYAVRFLLTHVLTFLSYYSFISILLIAKINDLLFKSRHLCKIYGS